MNCGQFVTQNTACSEGINLPIPIWAIAAIIVGALLFIGLLIIVVIKLCLYYQVIKVGMTKLLHLTIIMIL